MSAIPCCRFSVITPVWNRSSVVRQALSSVCANTDWQDGELIVVDQGSDAETQAVLREFVFSVPRFRLLENGRNEGVARGLNLGLRIAEGDTLVCLGSDIVVPEGWIDELERCLNHPQVGSAAICSHSSLLGASLEHEGHVVRTAIGHNTGGMAAFRRWLHNELGYFCEDFGLYGEEDFDFGFRLLEAGYLNVYSDVLQAVHLGDGDDTAYTAWKHTDLVVRQQRAYDYCAQYRRKERQLRIPYYLGG